MCIIYNPRKIHLKLSNVKYMSKILPKTTPKVMQWAIIGLLLKVIKYSLKISLKAKLFVEKKNPMYNVFNSV